MTETETTSNVTEKEYLQARRDYDESARSILTILQNSENRGMRTQELWEKYPEEFNLFAKREKEFEKLSWDKHIEWARRSKK